MTIEGSSGQENTEVRLKHYTYFTTKEVEFEKILEGENYIINGRLYEYGIPFSKEYVFDGDYGLEGIVGDCVVPRRNCILFNLSKKHKIFKTDLRCNFYYNDFKDKTKSVICDKKQSIVGAEIKTQYESMVDEQKQNKDICSKYNLNFHLERSFIKQEVCEVIKKLEIDIFNLRESLKLSQELNASYEKTIKEYRDNEGNERAN